MTDPIDDLHEPTEPQLSALEDLLGSGTVWAEPMEGLEDGIVGAVTAEVRPDDEGATPAAQPDDVISIERLRPSRKALLPMLGAAAVALLIAGAIVLFDSGSDNSAVVELAGTDLAPAANAEAEVHDTDLGTQIILIVTGLAPAPDGFYYQAWVRSADGGVSAGTFHLRGGDGEIELWAGVSSAEYPVITVSLQEEGAGPESSGMVVLQGERTQF